MPRLMSVKLTEQAVLERRKRVTRRSGWTMLHVGDHLTLCRQVMGRKKGEPLIRLCDVEVVSIRRERLDSITDEDVILEGFTEADWTRTPWGNHGPMTEETTPADWFVQFFCHHMGGHWDQEVTRVEWAYL